MAENVNETTVTPAEEPKTPSIEELSAQIASLQSQLEKSKQAYNTASTDAADWKKKFRDTQDEATRKEAERDEAIQTMKAQLAEYEKASVKATHKAAFIAMGYPEDLADRKAALLADGKITEAMSVEKDFLAIYGKQIKAESVRSMPTPASGFVSDQTITAEKFKNMSLRERADLHRTQPEVYANLVKEITK